MINQIYNLNMIPDKVPVMVRVSQYDQYSRTIIFDLYDGAIEYEIPTGSTITIRGTKPDKTGFEYPCTFNGNRVEFLLEPQVSVISGLVPAELRITSNNEIVGSCNFIFNVEETPLDKDTIISDTELPLIEEASQAAVIAQGAAARAEAEADRAEQVLSSAVKSVNNELPDAQGNVDIVALPDGGKAGQILTKQSSTDGDADWENPLINYEITGTVPSGTPLNADLLQGHPASYFATQSEVGTLSNLTTTDKTSLVGAINEVNAKAPVLLWTNPSPSSNFDAQTISLDLSQYSCVICYLGTAVGYTNVLVEALMIRKGNVYPVYKNDYYNYRRELTLNNNGITFSNGVRWTGYASSTSQETVNNHLIPMYIYGIK